MRRGQHAKATGCVRGVLTTRTQPEDLRYYDFSLGRQGYYSQHAVFVAPIHQTAYIKGSPAALLDGSFAVRILSFALTTAPPPFAML